MFVTFVFIGGEKGITTKSLMIMKRKKILSLIVIRERERERKREIESLRGERNVIPEKRELFYKELLIAIKIHFEKAEQRPQYVFVYVVYACFVFQNSHFYC